MRQLQAQTPHRRHPAQRPTRRPGKLEQPERGLLFEEQNRPTIRRASTLLHALGDGTKESPEFWYRQALDMATGLDAKMMQLRAAIRLCRLRRDDHEPEEKRVL